MHIRYSAWTLAVVLFVVLGTDVDAGRTLRDVSGDPMQRYNSQMMSSPMTRFPGILGISVWPYINYPAAPSTTIVNVEVQIPGLDQPPAPTSAPAARPKFWIARCGGFTELEVTPTTNLLDEERKPCSLIE